MAATDPQTVELQASEFRFDPDRLTVKPGVIRFVIHNVGELRHVLTVEWEGGIGGVSIRIPPGQTKTLEVTLEWPGSTQWRELNREQDASTRLSGWGCTMPRDGERPQRAVWLQAWLMASLICWGWGPASAETIRRGDPLHGQRLYGRYCAHCHGIEGAGTGRNAPYLEQLGRAPRDHTDAWYMNRLSDEELYRAISEGKLRPGEPPFMPWWGMTLTVEEIWDLVAFIRSLAREGAE